MEIPPPWTKGKPTRENCDPTNPLEHALWGLVTQTELWFPTVYMQLVSKRLWDCGIRYVAPPAKPVSEGSGIWMHQIPTRENCDPDDPHNFALWCLVALPGMRGAPLVREIPCLQRVSRHLWNCGFRQVEDAVIEYQVPTGREPDWATTPGRWMSVDAA